MQGLGFRVQGSGFGVQGLQGYLADKKPPPPLGPPQEPRHGPTVGSYGVAVSYKRGTPVRVLNFEQPQ